MGIVAIVLGLLLAASVVVAGRARAAITVRIGDLLELDGDDSSRPNSPAQGFDRLESRLRNDHIDLSPQRTEAALDRMTTGVVIADADGTIVFRNSIADPFAARGNPGDALAEDVIHARLADAVRGVDTDEELRLDGPPQRFLVVTGSPLVTAGELIGAIVLVDDVSEQQRLDAVRRDFVANVSHELRTPVGALSLLAETIEGESDPGTVARFMDRIQNETTRLARLIDDLLDLSRIEGGMGDRVEPMEIAGVLAEARASVAELAESSKVELRLETNDLESAVVGDRGQLVSAVTNLFENGVKYTAAGGSVTAHVSEHGDELSIAVADTGVGIPEPDRDRVFERFYRVDRGRSSETGGTGLGLSIVRHVAVNHGGRVELESTDGEGSIFTIVLPLARDTAQLEDA
ncbi:MAG: sensor histidine kinase [Acidimicrobiales bacterium]